MGIRYINSYRILSDTAQVLVCPTNAGGVMGAGLAKVFREQIPGLFSRYRRHCAQHDPSAMVPFIYPIKEQHFVYCLHTKCKYWQESSLDIVKDGLAKLVDWCIAMEITSVALPALGCGRGGLTFEAVQIVLDTYLKDVNIDFRVYHRE